MSSPTRDIIEGKWKQLKGSVQERWGELTNDEIDELEGNRDQLAGKLQERYGIAREQADREINEWLESVDFN